MEYFLAEIFKISIPNPISNGDFWQILTKVYLNSKTLGQKGFY